MLPDCGPEDKTISWISKLPVATDKHLTTDADVPVLDDTVVAVDKPDQSDLGDLTMGGDCSVKLTDPQPTVPAPTVDTLPSNAGSRVGSGTEHGLVSEGTQGLRSRYSMGGLLDLL